MYDDIVVVVMANQSLLVLHWVIFMCDAHNYASCVVLTAVAVRAHWRQSMKVNTAKTVTHTNTHVLAGQTNKKNAAVPTSFSFLPLRFRITRESNACHTQILWWKIYESYPIFHTHIHSPKRREKKNGKLCDYWTKTQQWQRERKKKPGKLKSIQK